MKIQGTISILLVLVVGGLGAATAVGQSKGQTALVVNVEPMAQVGAPLALVWGASGGAAIVELPIHTMLRLNQGATADLSIAMTRLGGMVEVEGSGGFHPLSESPLLLHRFSRSGVYDQSFVLRVSPAEAVPDAATLRVRLTSSDGSAEGLTTVEIRK